VSNKSRRVPKVPPNFSKVGVSDNIYSARTMPEVLVSLLEFLPEAIVEQVGACLIKFWASFIEDGAKIQKHTLAEYAKASKNRLKLFRSTSTLIMTNLAAGEEVLVLDKDGYFYSDGFIPLAERCKLSISAEGEFAMTDFISQCHPRSYRYLYDGLVIILLHYFGTAWSREAKLTTLSCYCCLAQSIGQAYELLEFTDRELLDLQTEWLNTITAESPEVPQELEDLLVKVFSDIRENKHPYINDIVPLIRRYNGFLRNRKWNVEDYASGATTASASRNKLIKSMPNKHVLMAMCEQDVWSFPGDDIIGYYSNYPEDSERDPEGVAFRSLFIRKTTRGYRSISLPSGPIRDRANYFLKGIQPLYASMITDCTSDQHRGGLFVQRTTAHGGYWSISLDLDSATDRVSQHFLRRIWELAFGAPISEYLSSLSSGPTVVTILKEDGSTDDIHVRQTRGIKQGIPFVFELGLTFAHHILMKCVMKAMKLEHLPAQEVYRILGDDSFTRLKLDGPVFVRTYTNLMTLAGFKVHDLSEKGICTPPNCNESLGEFSKKVYFNGSVISPIPFKLFFKANNLDSEVSRLNWLVQYQCFEPCMPAMVRNLIWRHREMPHLESVLYTLYKYKVMDIKIPSPKKDITEDEELTIMVGYVRKALQHSLIAHILDPKGRKPEELQSTELEFFKRVNVNKIIGELTDYAHDHGVEVTTLDFLNMKNSFILERARDLLLGHQLESYLLVIPFDDGKVDLFLTLVEILESPQAAQQVYLHDELMEKLVQAKQFVASIRQHDVVGCYSRYARILTELLTSLEIVQPGV